ncbi:MAG: ORF6N domain-containing protein [Saprospiraceae bacterium]|nr:ORF6N domain-containing protein [Saprospiraceae bacterium]
MEIQIIQSKIHLLRGQRVMLDYDLAELYQVETRALKQAVRRNTDRFPPDFLFQLTEEEQNQLVSQNVIPSKKYFGGATPFAFTEHDIAQIISGDNSWENRRQIGFHRED